MDSRFIYFFIVLTIAYNIFFDSYAEKQTYVLKLRNYLMIEIPQDTEVVEYISNMKHRFTVWSELESSGKNVNYTIEQLEKSGWELTNVEENHERIYYSYKKGKVVYGVCDYKNSDRWGEDVFVEE